MAKRDFPSGEPESVDAILASDRFVEQLRTSGTFEPTTRQDAAVAAALLAMRDDARQEPLTSPPWVEETNAPVLRQPHRIVRRSVAVAGMLLAMSSAAATALDGDPLRPVRYLVEVGVSVGEDITDPSDDTSSEGIPPVTIPDGGEPAGANEADPSAIDELTRPTPDLDGPVHATRGPEGSGPADDGETADEAVEEPAAEGDAVTEDPAAEEPAAEEPAAEEPAAEEDPATEDPATADPTQQPVEGGGTSPDDGTTTAPDGSGDGTAGGSTDSGTDSGTGEEPVTGGDVPASQEDPSAAEDPGTDDGSETTSGTEAGSETPAGAEDGSETALGTEDGSDAEAETSADRESDTTDATPTFYEDSEWLSPEWWMPTLSVWGEA